MHFILCYLDTLCTPYDREAPTDCEDKAVHVDQGRNEIYIYFFSFYSCVRMCENTEMGIAKTYKKNINEYK